MRNILELETFEQMNQEGKSLLPIILVVQNLLLDLLSWSSCGESHFLS